MRPLRFFACFALIIALLLPMAASAEAENLLVNPSFEELETDGLPTGWYEDAYVRQEGYTLYSVVDDAKEGGRSVQINNLGLNDARFAQEVAVEPETLYRLSGWIKTEEVSEEGWGANLSIEDVYVLSEGVHGTSDGWTYVELYGETGEDQYEVTVFARLGGYSGESVGVARFDSLRLEQVDEVPGNAVAPLWFRQTTPQIEPIDETDEEAEAAPFWPWLLALSAVFLALCLWALPTLTVDRHELTEKRRMPAFLVAALAAAFIARLIVAMLVDGYQVDVNCFLSWGATMRRVGPTAFYGEVSFCDYPPAYLYALGFNSLLADGVQRLLSGHVLLSQLLRPSVIFKLIPMLCDLAAAVVIYYLAREEKCSRNQAGLLSVLIAFNPATFVGSAAWCQMDIVLCLMLMLVAYFAIHRKWLAALPLYMLSVLIKPQALMLGFLGLAAVVIAWIRHAEDRRAIGWGLAAAVAVAAVVVIPFGVHQPFGWLISRYGQTLSSYPYATLNTANLYYLAGGNWAGLAQPASLLVPLTLTALTAGWGAYLFLHQKGRRLFWLESALMGAFAAVFAVLACVRASWGVVGFTAMALCFAVVLPMFIRQMRLRNLPLCGAVLFILLYVFGVKMHERYLLPALLLLGMAFALHRDRRLLLLLAGLSCVMFVNEGIVLDNSVRLGSSMGHLNLDTQWLNNAMSVVNVLLACWSVWVGQRVCEAEAPRLDSEVRTVFPHYETLPRGVESFRTDPSLHWRGLDWVLMLAVTAVYAVVALCNLGSAKAPQNPWKSSAADETVVFDLGRHYDEISMLYFCQVSYHDFSVAASEDGAVWSEEYWAEMAQGQCFRWKYLSPSWIDDKGNRSYYSVRAYDGLQKLTGRYVRLTSQQIGLIVNEIVFRDENGTRIPATVISRTGGNEESPLYSDPEAMLDEQDTLEGEPSWYNSTYFDEIYHARTAYEHLNGTVPYETSHPPLGKVLMSWCVALFGMTPFGWRFAGAFCGILMLPAMYLLGKQLTKRTDMAFAASAMLALDCMHLTQTRIATIDSFPVLFILLSYFFMLRFMQRDIVLEPLKCVLPDLALSGFMMGCGVASKWIGVYAGAGLAVLYFWTCGRHMSLSVGAARALRLHTVAKENIPAVEKRDQTAMRRIVVLCLWCVLFFIVVPVIIYLLSYIPYFAYARKDSLLDYVKLVLQAQEGMFNYHSTPGLGMDHPFYSPWYEWPVIGKPMYYASAQFVPAGYSYAIFCFGNPMVWYVGLAGMASVLLVWAKRHCYTLPGSDFASHWLADRWSVAPAFVLIGLLAQFLPWVLVPRGTYIYHYFASVPFLILGTTLLLYWLARRFPRGGRMVLIVYLVLCLISFIAFYPYASGILTPTWWLDFMKRFLHIYY